MFRSSDHNCSTPDAAPPQEIDIPFRPKFDCLSEEATKQVQHVFDFCKVLQTNLNTSISKNSFLDQYLYLIFYHMICSFFNLKNIT